MAFSGARNGIIIENGEIKSLKRIYILEEHTPKKVLKWKESILTTKLKLTMGLYVF